MVRGRRVGEMEGGREKAGWGPPSRLGGKGASLGGSRRTSRLDRSCGWGLETEALLPTRYRHR